MCQSKAQGGRRCAGHAGSARTPAGGAATAVATREGVATAAAEVRVLEDRDRVDQLASRLPADRTGVDGKPLNDADRRMYALRESGYRGPIDQDGYPATSGQGPDILRRLAEDRGEQVDW